MTGPAPFLRRPRCAPAWAAWALAAAIGLAAALPYACAGVSRSFINFDDQEYVYENPRVLAGLTPEGALWALTSFHAANWHPLTWFSHMTDVSLYGLDARGHHATSILLHALGAALLFVALRRLTGALWPSAFVAAMFGVHPLNVESVAWVSERKDVLSGLLFTLVLLAYERYARRGGARRYLAVALLLALGLAAKPMLVTVPFVLLLLDYWPLGRTLRAMPAPRSAGARTAWGGLLAEKIPLLALAGVSGVLTILAQRAGQTVVTVETIAPGARLANAAVSYLTYAGKAVWPARLGIYYPYPYDGWPLWAPLGAAAALGAVSAATLLQLRRRPFLAVGWFWFLGMLVPVIGLLQVGEQARADRYTYLPLVGLFILAAWGALQLLRGARSRRAWLGAGAAAIVALYAAATAAQASLWRDGIALYTNTLKVTTGNWQILNTLGAALIMENRHAEALGHLQEAVRNRPDFATARYNLGVALSRLGRRQEAIDQFREAVRIRPGHVRARYNLGCALAGQGQPAEAAVHLRMVLGGPSGAEALPSSKEPAADSLGELDAAIARFWLGTALADLGRPEEAIQEYREVLSARPGWAQAHDGLGSALAAQGRIEEALVHFTEALRIQPGFAEAHYNMGNASFRAGRFEQALAHYREAGRLRPGLAETENNLGNALASLGRFDEALAHYREALRLRPDFTEARNNLATVLAERGGR